MNINEKSKFKHLTAFILVILAEDPRNRRDIDTEQLQDFPGFTIGMFTVYRCLSCLKREGLVTIWKEDIKIRKHNFKVFLQKFNERKI
ncbi:PadR family transcriptional regulator [Treponema denticola]|uniref:PadR family transcriptional regulator n=1 Tax=Treponema denticola TaxID=158 RepID=UPI0011CA6203|nr:PadR family transcriptional regulator [Treponema denticola]